TAATVIPTETTAAVVAAQQQQQQQEFQQTGHETFNAAHDLVVAVAPKEALSEPPKFKPKRKGGRGFVSIGARIDRYYQSQLCAVCKKLVVGQKPNTCQFFSLTKRITLLIMDILRICCGSLTLLF